MLRVHCDFNDETDEGLFWLLFVDGTPLEAVYQTLRLREGDEVLLFQDEDDFEVKATLTLDRAAESFFLGRRICARPDWDTIKRVDIAVEGGV